jgi:hypothetical protein
LSRGSVRLGRRRGRLDRWEGWGAERREEQDVGSIPAIRSRLELRARAHSRRGCAPARRARRSAARTAPVNRLLAPSTHRRRREPAARATRAASRVSSRPWSVGRCRKLALSFLYCKDSIFASLSTAQNFERVYSRDLSSQGPQMPSIFLERLAISLLGRAISKALAAATAAVKRPTLPILRTHYAELTASLSRMPFIYKDLTTLVLKDFVQVEIETLSSLTLEPRKETIAQVSSDQRIRNRRKAIFIGNAGIGKTTFFRYTALSLIKSPTASEHFFPGEKLVSFYVPLKAVDNTKALPIFRYLLESHKYLAGTGGLKRLINLARQKRLLLLLDGYDEIYLPPPNQRNFVVDELNVLIAQHLPSRIVKPSQTAIDFYKYAGDCRIWLSTRREFYALHPLDLNEDRDRMNGPLGFVALAVNGLHNRSLLVNKIFDIYRNRADIYQDRLSEESFLQDIDLAGDDELVELSHNPLFLTVMCYIYAHNIGDGVDGSAEYSRSNMSRLVLVCIDLLLKDLDSYKVRDLPPAQREVFREVFEKRRSLYKEEKEAFLGFFASRLLTRGMPVFNESEIIEAAREFFRIEYRDGHADEILRSLESRQQSSHGFVKQILNQGIFVLVPKTGDQLVYDFPHRRFREVLAARYLNDHEHIDEILENLGNLQYAEFLYVFFSISQFQNQILASSLRQVSYSGEGRRFGLLVSNCLKVKPRGYDATPLLMEFLRDRTQSGRSFSIPKDVLDHLFPSKEELRWLAQQLRLAIGSGNPHLIATISPALLRVSKALLLEILETETEGALKQPAVLTQFTSIMAAADPDLLLSKAPEFKVELTSFRAWLWACSGNNLLRSSSDFLKAATSALSHDQLLAVVDVLQDRDPSLLARIEPHLNPKIGLEVLVAIVRHIRHPERKPGRVTYADKVHESGDAYVITRRLIQMISDPPARDHFRPLIGKVLFESDLPKDKFTEETMLEIKGIAAIDTEL